MDEHRKHELVMVCQGDALGMGMHEGKYLKAFDVDAADGRGTVEWTEHLDEAIRFADFTAFFEAWRTQGNVIPLRPDGRPNRPLTAWNVEPRTV